MAEWSIYKNHGSDGKGDLVDPAQLPAAQEHKITIDIIPNANVPNAKSIYTLIGFMKDQFSYSVAAQYNKIKDIPSLDGFARYGKDLINSDASYHSGFFSKKMFEPGNAYSKLDLKFRIYDDPTITKKCDLLIACCLPMIAGDNPVLNTSVIAVGSDLFGKTVDAAAEVAVAATSLNVGTTIAAAMDAIMKIGTTRKPPHLNVKIGSYFSKTDMVLTNVEFTYSKEFVYSEKLKQSYPLYADFNISLESLYSMLAMSDTTDENIKRFGTGFEQSGMARVIVKTALDERPIKTIIKSAEEGWGYKPEVKK